MTGPPESPEDLDAAVSALYAGPPGAFVAGRQRLVKALRAAKRRDEAAAIAGLGRPTLVAWAANLAAVAHPERLAALLAAGRDLVAAQAEAITKGDASSLRSARSARQRAVGVLVDAAVAAGRKVQAGLDNHRDELASLFEAASVDVGAAGLLAKGQLARAPEATSGFGLLGSPDLDPSTVARAAPTRAPAKPAGRTRARGRAAEKAGDEPRVEETRVEETTVEETAASAAERRAAKAAVAEAERRVAAAERARAELAAALAVAREAVADADAAVAEHEAALAAARARQKEATDAVSPAELAMAEAEEGATIAAEVLGQARAVAAELGV